VDPPSTAPAHMHRSSPILLAMRVPNRQQTGPLLKRRKDQSEPLTGHFTATDAKPYRLSLRLDWLKHLRDLWPSESTFTPEAPIPEAAPVLKEPHPVTGFRANGEVW
jgi:hypothetical protein